MQINLKIVMESLPPEQQVRVRKRVAELITEEVTLQKLRSLACPCCHNITLPQDSRYEICPVCFWESDPIQNDDENYDGGANSISLKQARLNYQEFGAVKSAMQKNVRPPLDSEIPK